MVDPPATPGSTGRCEPRWLTLTDLLLAIVGVAVVLSLPRLHHLDDAIAFIGAQDILMPRWHACCLIVGEAAMKCGVIVLPVIVARRARYGGLPHPAEWLAIIVAMPWLHEAVDRYGAIQRFARWWLVELPSLLGIPVEVARLDESSVERVVVGGRSNRDYAGFPESFTPHDEYPIWAAFTAIIFLGLVTALAVVGKRLPAWARTVLLSAAAFTALEGVLSYLSPLTRFRACQAVSTWFQFPHDLEQLIASGVYASFDGLLLVVPFVAALCALRGRSRTCWTWTGWVGAAAALVALAADLGFSGSELPFDPHTDAWTRFAMLYLRLLVAGLAGGIVVRCAWLGGRQEP